MADPVMRGFSSPSTRLRLTISATAWVAVICALPLALLFEPRQQFGNDWVANVWFASYFGEYFKHHSGFPQTINTLQLAGMPYPVFYGFLLYPLLGLISSMTDPHAALRLAVGAGFFLQSWQVFRLVLQAGGHRWFGLLTAALVCWSTYALTNLYNRGALSELIAMALLTAAICAIYRAFLLPPGPERMPAFVTGLFCFVLAAGAHPITGLFGGMFLGFAIMVVWISAAGRRQLAGWLAVGTIAGALALSPWLYAVLKFRQSLYVSQHFTSTVCYLPESLDSLATRLMPFPFDRRMAGHPALSSHESPYLDTQVTIGLIILAVFLTACVLRAFRRRQAFNRGGVGIVVACWLSFLLILALSVSPALGDRMPDLFHSIQFAYRLVSYLNLSLLLVVVGGLVALSPDTVRELMARQGKRVLWMTLALAVLGLALKLHHGRANQSAAPNVSGSNALRMPQQFYGAEAYAVTNSSPGPSVPPPRLSLPVGTGSEFGLLLPAGSSLPAPEVRELGVQPFPWNVVLLNGRSVVTAEAVNSPFGTVVSLPAGETEITYAWRPDPAWVWLNVLSRTTLLVWFILILILHYRAIRRDFLSVGP